VLFFLSGQIAPRSLAIHPGSWLEAKKRFNIESDKKRNGRKKKKLSLSFNAKNEIIKFLVG
jgi:hypothetical protein